MQRFLTGLGLFVSAIAGVGVYMTQIGPDDAASNLSKWWAKFGPVPDWMTQPAIDDWGAGVFAIILFTGLVPLFWAAFTSRTQRNGNNRRAAHPLGIPQKAAEPIQRQPPLHYRRLSPNQAQALSQDLFALKDEIRAIGVTFVQGDNEAARFAQDIRVPFRNAGITAYPQHQLPNGPADSGVIISVKDPDNPPHESMNLKKVLAKHGIETTIGLLPDMTLGPGAVNFTLFIARNPHN